MEIYCALSLKKVLFVSELSLKAVQVVALAIRRFVVQVLNNYRDNKLELSTAEDAALGKEVTLNDKSQVTVLMEKFLRTEKWTKSSATVMRRNVRQRRLRRRFPLYRTLGRLQCQRQAQKLWQMETGFVGSKMFTEFSRHVTRTRLHFYIPVQ